MWVHVHNLRLELLPLRECKRGTTDHYYRFSRPIVPPYKGIIGFSGPRWEALQAGYIHGCSHTLYCDADHGWPWWFLRASFWRPPGPVHATVTLFKWGATRTHASQLPLSWHCTFAYCARSLPRKPGPDRVRCRLDLDPTMQTHTRWLGIFLTFCIS